MVYAQPDLVHGIPNWRILLQNYVVDYVLNIKNVDLKSVRILDLGCGLGYTLVKLSRLLPHGATLVGIDIVKGATDRARRLVGKTANKLKVNVRRVNAERTPFINEYFDIVISNLSFSVFKRPGIVASEVVRILKTNGRLIATEVNKHSLLGKLGELFDSFSGRLYYRLYSPNELAKLFTQRGLKLNNNLGVPLQIRVLNRHVKAPFKATPVFLLEFSKQSHPSQLAV